MEGKSKHAGGFRLGEPAIDDPGKPQCGRAASEEHGYTGSLRDGYQHPLLIRFRAHDIRRDRAVHLRQVVDRGLERRLQSGTAR